PAANYCTGAPISIVVDNPQNFINYVWSSGCTQGSPHVAQVNPTSTPTTYTVTVTDAGGFTHTTTIVVQGTQNNLSFNIPATTYNTCANTPIQITATLQNGQAANFASYALYADQSADPGFANKQSDGYKFISNGSQFTQNVTPKKTTDYYIMASDGQCAAMSQKITVNVAPYADLGPDKEFCTSGTGIILNPYEEQIPPANVTYNWSTGSTSPTLSVATAGTYTVTVTDLTNTCTTTDNIVLTPISCCNNSLTNEIIPPNTIIDKGYTNANLQITTTNGLTVISPKVLPAKQNLEIQGTIHIMDNVRLQNFATINCSEAAQIDVRPYSRFGIFDSYVKSCTNYLWKGIDVKRFGDLVIKSVNKLCKITEAEFGVTIRKDCTIEIEDIDFVDNFVGLFVPPTINFELANDVDITITGSRFYCDNNLKLAYGGLSPQISNYVPKTVSLAGMVLNQTASSIGVSLQNYNQFGNSNTSKPKMNYGIIAYNSALNVQATMFQNIADIDKYGKLGGTSIYSSNQYGYGSLIETGLGKQNSTPTISNSYRSIYIDHGTATIKQNFISSCDFGPTLYYSPGGNSLFESNKIITRIASLWLSYNFNANLVETKLNQYLNANYVPNNIISAGIVVLEPDKFTKLIMHESQYILGGAYTKYGMYISMVHGAVIGCHDIDLSLTLQTNMSLGMYVARGGDNDLRRITIKGNGNYSYCNTEGMHFLSSTKNIIRCNSTNNNKYGFVFDGVCTMPERFKTNEIKNAYEGLHVSSEGLMDNQTNTGNTWTGSFTNYGANNERINKYLSTTDVVKYSISGTNNLPLLPANQIGWFVQSTASDATCDTASCVYIKPIIGDGETATDIAIASGTIGFPQFEEEMIHAAEQQEAENLSLNQDSIDNDTLLTFLNNYRNSNNGIFQLINDTILNIVDNNKIQFAFNDSIVRYNLQIGAVYDSIIVDSLSSSLTISNARIIKLKLLNEVNQLLHQNQLYSQQYQNNLGSRINIALQMNNAANTFGKTYISNEKVANEMFLQSLIQQDSDYTSAQWQTLKSIAAQCPHTGGKGVIKARNLILSKCDSIFWDDAPTCALEGYRRKAKKEGVDDIAILSPNPAKYYTDLLYKTNDDIALTLKVLDNYGQVILVKQLNQNQNTDRINTSLFPNGCYQIELFSGERKVSCQKLIILK
ncbi:MAG TPA: T9SS type A sorting domain-containing protein, partial [Bacteroidia bacterium]|nr:T9SS type A sorting domain-containing protein [Bacteroidia bacterium]